MIACRIEGCENDAPSVGVCQGCAFEAGPEVMGELEQASWEHAEADYDARKAADERYAAAWKAVREAVSKTGTSAGNEPTRGSSAKSEHRQDKAEVVGENPTPGSAQPDGGGS